MKKNIALFFSLLLSTFHIEAQTKTEWPAGNPPFKEHHLVALWTESFELDSVTINKDTTRKALITVPNDLKSIDKAIAAYVSFNTKAWGNSLYQITYFKDIDFPQASIIEKMNSEDHKKNGYYKHYLTLHLTYDTTEIVACFVETYYSPQEPKVYYLLMFENKGDTWYLLGGNPYQYLKSLSQIKFQYVVSLMQGLKLNTNKPNASAYNELLTKVYQNNSINLAVLSKEIIPNIFDKDSIKKYKSKYADLLTSPGYTVDWSLISNKTFQVKSFHYSERVFPTYFENMKPENNKRFILDESKLDFSTEESALASLYSTQSKATFDKYAINSKYEPYWPKRVRELDTLNSKVYIKHKFAFSFNGTYYSIVGYQLVINGSGLQFSYARFIRKWDNTTSKFLFYKDGSKTNYKLDEITWMIGSMDEGFLKRLCNVETITDPEEQTLINNLKTNSVIDFNKIIIEWYKRDSPLKKRLKRPH